MSSLVDVAELGVSPADLELQEEVRTWLADHLVGEFAAAGQRGTFTGDEDWDIRMAWDRELAAGRWLCIGWPEQYGGRGAGLIQEIIFHLEYARARAPFRAGANGQDLFGPMLLQCGSPELKDRFLPRIADGTEYWAQGFSEPNAGSDLANVQTRARLEADSWVLDGQKVWTSLANHSDWLYVLCKSNPEAARHRNLTMLIISAQTEGVDIRPIRNLAGGEELNEVFLSGARTPREMVIGEVDGGWQTAMTTLGIERGVDLLPHQLSFERELDDAIDAGQNNGAFADPELRRRAVDSWIELNHLRALTRSMLRGIVDGDGSPYDGSIIKLFASHWHQRLGALVMEIGGLDTEPVAPGYGLTLRQHVFLDSRAETIYGGTSEIQRNILSERVLELPREPRVTAAGATR